MWLKAFGIGFGTFPSDDTGVFHILEHSVLAGSEKYPVKSPFLQLLKSSMASFLNAMTFPDKTVYGGYLCPHKKASVLLPYNENRHSVDRMQ